MKKECCLKKAFGVSECDLADLPRKISGTTISRFVHGVEAGCAVCFPHGYEVSNSHFNNRQRSWKVHRRTKWKTM